MGPRRFGTLLLALAASVVAGCDALPGRDPESGFVPQAGVCHLTPGDNASGEAYQPVECSTRHEAETFLVGRFAGADAGSAGPPATGSDAALRAYASCATAAEVLAMPPMAEQSAAGETGVLCFLYREDRPLTRSLAGVGRKGLPAPMAG